MNKNTGIDLTGRKMMYQPWSVDDKGSYKEPHKNEIEEVYCISGEAVAETLLYFEERCAIEKPSLSMEFLQVIHKLPKPNLYPHTSYLIHLLNTHIIDEKFKITKEELLDKSRWYSSEYYFYFIMFTKKVIRRYDFHFGEGNTEQLSIYHKIYEKGKMDLSPWGEEKNGDQVNEFSMNNVTPLMVYLEEELNVPSHDFIRFINNSTTKRFQVDRKFYNTETIWISLELICYSCEFFCILANNRKFLEKGLYNSLLHKMRIGRMFASMNKDDDLKSLNKIANSTGKAWSYNFIKKKTFLTIEIQRFVKQKESLKIQKFHKYISSIYESVIASNIGAWSAILYLIFEKKPSVAVQKNSKSILDFVIIYKFKKNIWGIFFNMLFSLIIFFLSFFINTKLNYSLWFNLGFSFFIALFSFYAFYFRKNFVKIRKNLFDQQKASMEQLSDLEKISSELLKEKQNLELKIKDRTSDLADANKKLKELDILKTQLIVNISHEFRTPLSLIQGPAEMLESSGELCEEGKKHLHTIILNTTRLKRMIEQLLTFTRIQESRLKPVFRKINLVKFMDFVLASIESGAFFKKIELTYEKPVYPVFIEADVDHLEMIVMNLLSNAFKFTPKGGKITITLSEKSQEVVLKIKDTGIGIPESKIPFIFERFYQADSDSSRKYEGSGIGLSLAKELSEMNHASIYAESKFQNGSLFSVVFQKESVNPNLMGGVLLEEFDLRDYNLIDFDSNTLYKNKKNDVVSLSKKDCVILIVEDNEVLSHYIKIMLTPFYQKIIIAKNGKDALNKISKITPDLILSDIMMPEMSGIEFLIKIREDKKLAGIPFIFLTAKADIEHKLEGLEKGADDYIAKPFEQRELITRIKNLLGNRKKLLEQMILKITQEFGISLSVKKENQISKEFLEKIQSKYSLTQSEIKILELLFQNKSQKEIAKKLFITTGTVKRHIHNIYEKTGVHNREQLDKLSE